jgi:hypothetical protein
MFRWLRALFNRALRAINIILKIVFDCAFKILMAKLKDVATESIKRLATSNLSSDQKRKQAFKEIKEYAISKALTFNDSDIYLIIETIHKALKKQGIIE